MKKGQKKKSMEQKVYSPHPYQSTSKMKVPSSVQGLVTNKQSIMSKTESEMAQYSQKTNKTYTSRSQDMLTQEDDQQLEAKEIFVNQQEQKVIQKILEVARKGKINQGNAFNLPLKVLENQNLSEKFWKFASELLGASIHIYEKRIQNTWTSTNLIQSQLIRMAGEGRKKQQSEDNEQQDERESEVDTIKVSLEQFRNPKNLQNMAVFMGFLEEPQNLNKKFDQSLPFKPINCEDPSNLLLNSFSINNDYLELSTQKKHNINNIDSKVSQEWDQKLLEMMRNHNTSHKSLSITNQIFLYKNNEEKVYQSELIQYDEFLQTALFNQRNFQSFQIGNDQKTSSLNDEIHTQIPYHPHSEQHLTPFSQSRPFDMASDGLFGMSECDKSFHSVMTPWQYQFKEGKLKKARRALKSRRNDEKKSRVKKQMQEPGYIQFQNAIQSKKIVFKKRKEPKSSDNPQFNDKNLLAPQLAIYEKIVYNKANRTRRSEGQAQRRDEVPDFLGPDPSVEPHQDMHQNVSSHPAEYKDYIQVQDLSGNQRNEKVSLLQLKSMKKKKQHFRQTQKYLYQRLKEDRQVRLKQVIDANQENRWNISAQQIFLGFLHVATSKNLSLKENYQQSMYNDIILSYQ